jgi:hypothetical protein
MHCRRVECALLPVCLPPGDFRRRFSSTAQHGSHGVWSLKDFISQFWEGDFLKKDANNILSMMSSWQNGDISANSLHEENFDRALGGITAKGIVMPGRTGPYFPPEDSDYEVSKMPKRSRGPSNRCADIFVSGPVQITNSHSARLGKSFIYLAYLCQVGFNGAVRIPDCSATRSQLKPFPCLSSRILFSRRVPSRPKPERDTVGVGRPGL